MHELLTTAPSPITDGTYFVWGDVSIQSGNLAVIVAMLILFGLALVLPFPGGKRRK